MHNWNASSILDHSIIWPVHLTGDEAQAGIGPGQRRVQDVVSPGYMRTRPLQVSGSDAIRVRNRVSPGYRMRNPSEGYPHGGQEEDRWKRWKVGGYKKEDLKPKTQNLVSLSQGFRTFWRASSSSSRAFSSFSCSAISSPSYLPHPHIPIPHTASG